jgi:hypothetical protein
MDGARGGDTPAVELRLKMVMARVQQRVGGVELGVWVASPGSGLPFMWAGGEARGRGVFNGR